MANDSWALIYSKWNQTKKIKKLGNFFSITEKKYYKTFQSAKFSNMTMSPSLDYIDCVPNSRSSVYLIKSVSF